MKNQQTETVICNQESTGDNLQAPSLINRPLKNWMLCFPNCILNLLTLRFILKKTIKNPTIASFPTCLDGLGLHVTLSHGDHETQEHICKPNHRSCRKLIASLSTAEQACVFWEQQTV